MWRLISKLSNCGRMVNSKNYRVHMNVGRANLGKPFAEVCLHLADGSKVRGFRNEDHNSESVFSIWVGKEIIPRFYPTEAIQRIDMIPVLEVPPQLYTPHVASTGGLGKHIRWTISIPVIKDKTKDQKATLIVGNIKNDEHWEKLKAIVHSLNALMTFTNNMVKCYESEEIGKYTSLTLLDNQRGPHVGFMLADLDFYPVFPNEMELKEVDLIAERLDRSPHMYLEQEAKCAGPQRDAWRWKLGWLPSNWNTVFTWPGYAMETYNELARNGINPISVLDKIPSPLNYYMWEHYLDLESANIADLEDKKAQVNASLSKLRTRLNRLLGVKEQNELKIDLMKNLECMDHECAKLNADVNACHALEKEITEKERFLRSNLEKLNQLIRKKKKIFDSNPRRGSNFFMITPAISAEQNKDLLNAAVLYHYSVQTKEMMDSLENKLFRYSQTGFVERCLGTYMRDGNHRGFGQTLRNYSGEEKISPENMQDHLAVHIRNRVTIDNQSNKIWGCGGRVYRGRYPVEDNGPVCKKIKHFNMDETIRKKDALTKL